jgi:hypothetical protein
MRGSPNKADAPNAAMAARSHPGRRWRGVGGLRRWMRAA